MNKQLTIIPLLLAIALTQVPSLVLPALGTPQLKTIAATISPETIARQIVVKIQVGERRGSGTIIAKRGNRYTVLTNAHVTNKANTYRITTPDGKAHSAQCAQPLNQGTCTTKNHDLALLEFSSTQSYTVPTWGDSRALTAGETIYSAGYPFDGQQIQINKSQITQQTNKPLVGGYQIGYASSTTQGMSGGALLNAKGQLIGIIGFSSQPILNDGYQYQDGSQPAADEITQLRKSSFAIPIATLAKLDRQYAAFLPKNSSTTTAVTSTNYTGVVKRVDEIAQQITVRIEDKNGGNGSGVIVAKSGDTYYVVTAAHVVQSREGEKIATTLITPTQERIVLTQGEVNVVNKDVDVAVVKFKSQQNYRTATIGKYQFNKADWVFISGFPAKDRSQQRHLSVGKVQDRINTEFLAKERGQVSGSLSRGNNLIYSNLSLPGMSGGAVLDRQGRLVGINTGAENEYLIATGEQINFGLALGIPIATVIGVASQGQLPTARLQLTNTPTPKLTTSESKEIGRIQLSALSKPSQASTAKDWLDYANLLWRSGENPEAVVAFETAIKLLESNTDISERKEQLTIAYYGLGLAWQSNRQGSTERNSQPAIAAFERATKVDPGFYQSWRFLGFSLNELKRYPEALTAYQRAIEIKKDDFVLHKEQGDVLRELKRYPEAVSAYTKAVTLQPNHPWVYLNRGNAYSDQKQYSQAITDYTQAIKIDPQHAEAYYNWGVIYFRQEQYSQAIAKYNQAIKIDPQHAGAYNNRGAIYAIQKQYPQAIADLNYVIKLDPQYANAYNNRGLVYFRQKQYPQAISDYNQAIKIAPQDAQPYNNRGNVYAAQKQYSQAIADYTQAIKLDPQLAEPYSNRGSAYFRQQQYSQAIADHNQAIKLDPQLASAYNNRGLTYADQKQYPQAIADYSQAIKLEPQLANAYSNRGNVYAKQKQYPQAILNYNQAIKLDPQDAAAYNNRGNVYADQKQYSQAIADYTQAIKLDPQFADAHNGRGLVHADQQQYSQAIADYNQAIKLNPQLSKAYANRGNIYSKQKQYPQAILDFSQAIKLDPQSASAYGNRGILYREQEQYPQAIADFNKDIELDPQSASAYNNRGTAYADQKQYPQAIIDFSRAIELDPQYAQAYANRGVVYRNQKQYPQAIADFDRAIKLDPQFATAYYSRGISYAQQQQYVKAKNDLEKAAELFRVQNNTAGYQRTMALLQKLQSRN
jgi:tetratricopeptide (TPR) repeat protein/S1-C subfamily serine protease